MLAPLIRSRVSTTSVQLAVPSRYLVAPIQGLRKRLSCARANPKSGLLDRIEVEASFRSF